VKKKHLFGIHAINVGDLKRRKTPEALSMPDFHPYSGPETHIFTISLSLLGHSEMDIY
jgi:hypothetical protein